MGVTALSDRRSKRPRRCSLLKNEYSPVARLSTLAASQNTALRIGVLLCPFNPAATGEELLHGLGFCRLPSSKMRWLGALSRH